MGLNSGLVFGPEKNKIWRYCFDAVQRPAQPSERTYVPLPLLPESLPVAVKETPSLPTATARYAPFGLTPPLTP
jgi:hypothetical protein